VTLWLTQPWYGAYRRPGGEHRPLEAELTIAGAVGLLRTGTRPVAGTVRGEALVEAGMALGEARLEVIPLRMGFELRFAADSGEPLSLSFAVVLDWRRPLFSLSTARGRLSTTSGELVADVELRYDYRRDWTTLLRLTPATDAPGRAPSCND
jgi:hypothetical protein